MAFSAEVSMIVALVETQVVPLATPFVASELTSLDTFLASGLTPAEISAISTGAPKIVVGLLNYAINHVAAGTPPAPAVAKPIVIPAVK